MTPQPTPTFLRPAEAAHHARVSRATIYRWLSSDLPSIRRGNIRLIKTADLNAFLMGGTPGSDQRLGD